MTIDVGLTAKAIDGIAVVVQDLANQLTKCAANMREESDIEFAIDAMNIIRSTFSNMRLDLLVSRPMRAIQKEHSK